MVDRCSTLSVCEPSDHGLEAAPSMGRHEDEVAAARFRGTEDRLGGRLLTVASESCATPAVRATTSALARIARASPAMCSLNAAGDITRSSAPRLDAP